MPRKYIRKSNKISYSKESLEKALTQIKSEKLKIREAGKIFGIPESTLRKHLATDDPIETRLGRKSLFGVQQEIELRDYILSLSNLFYGLTPKDLRKIAFEYAEQQKIQHSFNKEKGLAGRDWLYGFLKRHPEISVRQHDRTTINREQSFNQEDGADPEKSGNVKTNRQTTLLVSQNDSERDIHQPSTSSNISFVKFAPMARDKREVTTRSNVEERNSEAFTSLPVKRKLEEALEKIKKLKQNARKKQDTV